MPYTNILVSVSLVTKTLIFQTNYLNWGVCEFGGGTIPISALREISSNRFIFIIVIAQIPHSCIVVDKPAHRLREPGAYDFLDKTFLRDRES